MRFSHSHSILIFLLVRFCAFTANAASIGVGVALDSDLQALLVASDSPPSVALVAGTKIHRLTIAGHTVTACIMKSGPIESAISIATLASGGKLDLLLTIGVAGAIGDDHPIGSWVRVGEVLVEGDRAGAIVLTEDGNLEVQGDHSGHLIAAIRVRSLSVARFVSSSEQRRILHSAFGAHVVEMNLAGVVRVCVRAKLKQAHWRIISDRADDTAGADFDSFVKNYSGDGGRLLAAYLAGIPATTDDLSAYPNLKSLIDSPR